MSMDVVIGSRVTYGASGKTGVVRYLGEVDALSGEWCGIELDRPDGKHNGELNGRVYFTCPPNHGVFVKRAQVRLLSGGASSTARGTPASSPTPRPGSARGSIATPTTASATTSSRLQQMRERRTSGIGLAGSTATLAGRTASSSRLGTPSAAMAATAASGRRTPPPPSTGSTATPNTHSASGSASLSTRQSADTGAARRATISRMASPVVSSDELVEARARIAKLEEELDDRNRHVEQLKQSLTALREMQSTSDRVDSHPPPTPMEIDVNTGEDSVWIEKIEAIRLEAEEHVRSVRAEFEEHIAELQSEHESLIDELRLENATQGTEIKQLESELQQQKIRVAQFTTAEQKKVEEVALAVAKTNAGARKVESLESQITELQEMVETMALEKETLEMDKEIAEERVEELVAEVEKLKTSLALASSTSLPAIPGSAGDLADENTKLRSAVKALHDRSVEEKNELNKKIRQLQRDTSELASLREDVEQLAMKKTKLEEEVEELKELLDVANAYESMVEDLTEKNLTLGEKIADLEANVSSLESLKEMSEEMEHQHNEYEAELNNELETQRSAIQELKNALAHQKTIVEDRDRTIARFRDATARSREEVNELKTRLRAETGELENLKGATHNALNQTMSLRALAASARESEAEAAKQKINADQARLENAFLRASIPSTIFSEMDQKVLRVRLRLGRVAAKAEILVHYLRKELELMFQSEGDVDSASTLNDSERLIQQYVLGQRLSMMVCQAREDLFVLECHLTTIEEQSNVCTHLDAPHVEGFEGILDASLSAAASGSLFVSQSGESSVYSRLVGSLDEWQSHRATTNVSGEGIPLRCAVVKFRCRASAQSLLFAFAMMLVFMKTLLWVVSSPEIQVEKSTKNNLTNMFGKAVEELTSLVKLSLHLHRRADIDLSWSDDDLDGSIASGGDAVELIGAYAAESQNLWTVLQGQLSVPSLQSGCTEGMVEFGEQSLFALLSSLKERLAALFKTVCRGAFTDAVSSRSQDSPHEGRPQWLVRAQAIHNELHNASNLRRSLEEANEVCQALHSRVRELERNDSQHRVVAQKLESEALRLSDLLSQSTTEKAQLEQQLAREREQFNIALDESHKEKASLDNTNRELRKQLKRSSDIGVNSAPSSSRAKSALSSSDADAFRRAFKLLHEELRYARAALAKERIDRYLGPVSAVKPREGKPRPASVDNCAREVSQFARAVKAKLSIPRLVDLSQASTGAKQQLVARNLEQMKLRGRLADLRTRVGASAEADGWGGDVVNAITRGETVFGWRPPEMERPPVLLSRVTLHPLSKADSGDVDMEDASAAPRPPVQLLLGQTHLMQLTQLLSVR